MQRLKRSASILLVFACAVCSLCLYSCSAEKSAGEPYSYRWVYVSRDLSQDSHIDDIRAIADTCAAHGLNGIALSAGFDRLDIADIGRINRLFEVRQISRDTGVEIIPILFSAGYGGSVLAHNKNLAAGMPVVDALYQVNNGRAALVAGLSAGLANGGFEQIESDVPVGFGADEDFGKYVFADQNAPHSGSTCLRFENAQSLQDGSVAIATEIDVTPNRLYRMSLWIRVENTGEENPFGSQKIKLQATADDGRPLEWVNLRFPAEPGWHKVTEAFNSKTYDRVRISIEVRGGTQGTFWFDDLSVEEAGMVNLLRRPGTPLVVRARDGGTVFEEGKDFETVEDTILDFRFDHEGPDIVLTPASRIKEGQRLLVSFYHGIYAYNSQVTLCMSEPEVYDIWRRNARIINDIMHNSKWMLPMDEIRNGGSCKACQERNMTMGQIVGDCITRQTNILRWANPNSEIFMWSDMVDPNHNARADRPYYYYVDGNYDGSWNYIPKDLHIVCWWYKMRETSLSFFSDLGYRTVGASYYDADDLENPKGWMEALDKTPNAKGIMYTTWLRKYDLLDDFGELVRRGE